MSAERVDVSHPEVDSFNAMDRFFLAVETKMIARALSAAQVREALIRGYGYEVGDAWDDWNEEATS